MAGGRQVEPVSGAVLLPLSETKPVDERRASLGGTCSNGAATDSSRHPFKEKHPLLQRCETVLTSSLLPSLVLALLLLSHRLLVACRARQVQCRPATLV